MENGSKDKVLIVWTSGDKEVAINMVFMYALNSKIENWWDEVTLLIWGPSSGLLAKDRELAGEISKMLAVGVRVVACKQCADRYGVSVELAGMGVEVFYTGKFLTEWLQGQNKVITV